ncbi:MAG TPA: copper resistance CopC family protein [Candidatus Limnocylindrales bacterium]|jgi:hypothetical protein
MSVTSPRRASSRAALLAVALLLLAALPAAAHAELVSADPANGATVQGPFDRPIVLTFSEDLASGSKADLKAADGKTLDSAAVAGRRMTITLASPLDAGTYTIQWTSVADDGHVERGAVTFTVTPPPPTPIPTPSATAAPTPTASPTPMPSPTPSGGGGTPAGGTADVLLPLLGVVIAVAALGAFLLRRRSARR